ncbi:hypothetical protein C8D72_2937 [Kushneria indalinina DSM 14324]|uniref:Uncharacterized protein n=1 Tax=Kushneria indalinina DSM 14324 TaxID=1122140 RepID=A0A3D9DS62_9GAMM|nr:hypothetical protein C8D72_2937 [Kushneria indalinina DSM 14324]
MNIDRVRRFLYFRLSAFAILDLIMCAHASYTTLIEGNFSDYATLVFITGQFTKNYVALFYICFLIENKNSLARKRGLIWTDYRSIFLFNSSFILVLFQKTHNFLFLVGSLIDLRVHMRLKTRQCVLWIGYQT